MYLVVGLAIAGLAGIVAAFYFSSRSGKRGGKRLRAGGSGRVAANRAGANRAGAAGRPGRAPRTGQTEFALRASGPPRTGGDSRLPGTRAGALTESWPSSPSDLEDFQPDDAWPADSAATDQGLRAADQGVRAARADADAFRDDKPRRRVGFRKGADVDEELWPADSFGGVSDEQFWDDLASDKPLTTTARTAQQEAGPRSRLLGNGPAADSPGRRAAGGGAYPGARPAPEPAAERTTAERTTAERTTAERTTAERTTAERTTAERTTVQPTYAATQPVKSMTPPGPGTRQPFQNAPQPPQPPKPAPPPKTAAPLPGAPQPGRAAGTGPSGQPRGATAQPGEGTRRRRPSSADEDPLTSAAFSLRQRGPVDGRSSHRSRDQRDAPGERNDAADGPGRGPASPYGHTAPYPSPGTSYDDASLATQMMVTPPYGENYGYGGNPADPPTQPRRHNGTRSHARPGDPDERVTPSRPAYPQDTRPASGSYPAGGAYGAYPGNGSQPGGHQGNGSRRNGHRAPHDPRDDYRRLTHLR